jgi:hypothetical protein
LNARYRCFLVKPFHDFPPLDFERRFAAILTLPFWLSRILHPAGLALLQLHRERHRVLSLGLLRILFWGLAFAAMYFLSAITPQIAVLGLGALVLAVVPFVLVSLALRE